MTDQNVDTSILVTMRALSGEVTCGPEAMPRSRCIADLRCAVDLFGGEGASTSLFFGPRELTNDEAFDDLASGMEEVTIQSVAIATAAKQADVAVRYLSSRFSEAQVRSALKIAIIKRLSFPLDGATLVYDTSTQLFVKSLGGASASSDCADKVPCSPAGVANIAAWACSQSPHTEFGCRVLGQAIVHADFDVIRGVFQIKADPNLALSEKGLAPIFRAAYCGHESVLRFLLEARGDTNLRNEWAHTPVDAARSQLGKAGGKGLGPREDGSGGLLQPCIDLLQRSSADTDADTDAVQ